MKQKHGVGATVSPDGYLAYFAWCSDTGYRVMIWDQSSSQFVVTKTTPSLIEAKVFLQLLGAGDCVPYIPDSALGAPMLPEHIH